MTTQDIQQHITAGRVKELYNITTDRLKKWREGRGQAKNHSLRTISLGKSLYLYNIEDIEKLIELTKQVSIQQLTKLTTKK
jgi:hypothetical protein